MAKNPFREAFGQRLKEARGKSVTLEVVGSWFEKTKQAAGHWESGQATPTAEELHRLCREFEVSADYLLFGDQRVALQRTLSQQVITALSNCKDPKKIQEADGHLRLVLGIGGDANIKGVSTDDPGTYPKPNGQAAPDSLKSGPTHSSEGKRDDGPRIHISQNRPKTNRKKPSPGGGGDVT